MCIYEHISTTHGKHKRYIDAHRTYKKFAMGEKVFLRVHLWKSLMLYGKGSKLAPHFVGLFEILERIGPIAYCLILLPSLAHVHDVFHVFVHR